MSDSEMCCEKCGTKLVRVKQVELSRRLGRDHYHTLCTSQLCVEGRKNLCFIGGGHDFGQNNLLLLIVTFGLGRDRCKKCGCFYPG